MTVLVSGATGSVGGAVFSSLRERGVDVRGGTRRPDSAGLPDGTAVAFDLTDPGTFGPALDGVDRVFLYAATDDIGAFLDAAAAVGRPHLVLLSSASVADPGAGSNPIAQHHLHLERAILAADLPHTFVRPGYFASNALRWAPSIRSDRRVAQPCPEAVLDPIHELDIADAAVAALTRDDLLGAAPVLTGGANLTQREQVEAVAAALGQPVELVEVDPDTAREQMARAMPGPVADTLVGLLADAVGHPRELTGQIEAVTGHAPRSFADWARDHVADFR